MLISQNNQKCDRIASIEPVSILLMRHGDTAYTDRNRYHGDLDISLNSQGVEKVTRAKKDLPRDLDLIVCSSLKRSRETAYIIGQSHPDSKLVVPSGLEEINHGDWSGLTETEIQSCYPDEFYRWKNQPVICQKPNGESLEIAQSRAIKAWLEIMRSLDTNMSNILIVSHAHINRLLLCHWLNLSLDDFWSIKQDLCCFNQLSYCRVEQKVTVKTINQLGNINYG